MRVYQVLQLSWVLLALALVNAQAPQNSICVQSGTVCNPPYVPQNEICVWLNSLPCGNGSTVVVNVFPPACGGQYPYLPYPSPGLNQPQPCPNQPGYPTQPLPYPNPPVDPNSPGQTQPCPNQPVTPFPPTQPIQPVPNQPGQPIPCPNQPVTPYPPTQPNPYPPGQTQPCPNQPVTPYPPTQPNPYLPGQPQPCPNQPVTPYPPTQPNPYPPGQSQPCPNQPVTPYPPTQPNPYQPGQPQPCPNQPVTPFPPTQPIQPDPNQPGQAQPCPSQPVTPFPPTQPIQPDPSQPGQAQPCPNQPVTPFPPTQPNPYPQPSPNETVTTPGPQLSTTEPITPSAPIESQPIPSEPVTPSIPLDTTTQPQTTFGPDIDGTTTLRSTTIPYDPDSPNTSVDTEETTTSETIDESSSTVKQETTTPPPAPILRCPSGTVPSNGNCRLVYCARGVYHNGRCVIPRCPKYTVWTGQKCSAPKPVELEPIYIHQQIVSEASKVLNNKHEVVVNASLVLPTRDDDYEDDDYSDETTEVPQQTSPKCCTVIAPRICRCQNQSDRWQCFNRRQPLCGNFCNTSKVVLKAPQATSWIEDTNEMLLMPPNPNNTCIDQGNCNTVANRYDCSGCASGLMASCSTYCYNYHCNAPNCGFYDQLEFCSSAELANSIVCQPENGWKVDISIVK
ncbi:uncharacterized protein LOC132784472 [Drosophila nasuta]|uniref:uncharacterized protein LOC132784472 n=1 Tax=Drosophila nasuta TaxID=42062 RepID=UPI00295EBB88|nr:uncharacterized protein LOC132784472 [Drosophila nasuta]